MSDLFETLPRRDFLLATGAVALGVAQSAQAAEEKHMHHAAGQYADLAHEAQHCVMQGNACLSHCIVDLKSGNLELVDCLSRVEELIAVCKALGTIAALGSEHVPAMAAVTKEVCVTCEEECRKFADKHDECAACADACLDCIKECDKVLNNA
jgi:Cys-rich four helix bundle protein (predicted Tat secretion target)